MSEQLVSGNEVQIEANRAGRKWTRREQAGRVLWSLAWPLFRLSPKLCWRWRCLLLRIFGATVGREVHIHPSATIFIPWNLEIGDWSSIGFDTLIYNLGPLRIGSRTTISQRAHLCGGTHDHHDISMPLVKAPITLQSDVWICADAFIGPGVIVGDRSVVAARAVVVANVEPDTVIGGNPAKKIGVRKLKQAV